MNPNTYNTFADIYIWAAIILLVVSVFAAIIAQSRKALKWSGRIVCWAAAPIFLAGAFLLVSIITDGRLPLLIWGDEDLASKMVITISAFIVLTLFSFFLGTRMLDKARTGRRI